MRDDHAHLWFLSSNALFASPPPPNLSTHRIEPMRVHSSLPTCLKLGVSESRLDGLGRLDLHGSGISSELSFSVFFLNCPESYVKLGSWKSSWRAFVRVHFNFWKKSGKQIDSIGRIMDVLQHTNEIWRMWKRVPSQEWHGGTCR